MGNTWSTKVDFNEKSILLGCGIILVFEGETLVRVLKGTKHRFVVKILCMLIGYNLCSIAEKCMYISMNKKEVYPLDMLKITISLSSLGLLLFGVSHWMFAFKYFSMSRQTPYKLQKTEVPSSIVVCD